MNYLNIRFIHPRRSFAMTCASVVLLTTSVLTIQNLPASAGGGRGNNQQINQEEQNQRRAARRQQNQDARVEGAGYVAAGAGLLHVANAAEDAGQRNVLHQRVADGAVIMAPVLRTAGVASMMYGAVKYGVAVVDDYIHGESK